MGKYLWALIVVPACFGCGNPRDNIPKADGPEAMSKTPPANTIAGKGARSFMQRHNADRPNSGAKPVGG